MQTLWYHCIQWPFLNSEDIGFQANISRMLRHQVAFQCPAYLEFHRGRVLGLGEMSRLHMGRLRVLKIPTMLCARTNFPKPVAENVRRGLSYDAHLAHLLACSILLRFPKPWLGSILASFLKEVTWKYATTKPASSRLRNGHCLN